MGKFFILINFIFFITDTFVIDKEIHKKWKIHKKKYDLSFGSEEEIKRFMIFKRHLERINQHNKENHTFTLEMNHLGHMEPNELLTSYLYNHTGRIFNRIRSIDFEDEIPEFIDWRLYNVVSSIKNQLYCGSCYAFSAIGVIESQFAIKTESLVEFSEQEIIDCSTEEGNEGCQGGLPDFVYQYVIKNGIEEYKDYKYLGRNSQCKVNKSLERYYIDSFINLPSNNENELIKANAKYGPIAVGINADSDEFMFYKSGIFKPRSCDPSRLNHAVIVVGYSNKTNEQYYIVKNSWGIRWGEQGYIRMALLHNNVCGIASDASFPVVKSDSLI